MYTLYNQLKLEQKHCFVPNDDELCLVVHQFSLCSECSLWWTWFIRTRNPRLVMYHYWLYELNRLDIRYNSPCVGVGIDDLSPSQVINHVAATLKIKDDENTFHISMEQTETMMSVR